MTLPFQCVRHPIDSPLGPMLLAASANGLVGVWFTGQKHFPAPELHGRWPLAPQHPVLLRAADQLARYFQGLETHPPEHSPALSTAGPGAAGQVFDVPLDLSTGSPFQQAVWRALLDIAPGDTCRYADIAQRIGRPGAARAVGAAVGRNPLSIVVPCHRVLGSGGALTGYAGGLQRKAALLRHESQLATRPGHAVSAATGVRAGHPSAAATAAVASDVS